MFWYLCVREYFVSVWKGKGKECEMRTIMFALMLVVVSLESGYGQKRIVADCGEGSPSSTALALMSQNRSVEIIVQTSTGARNNVCEGQRSDWREGLGQCLHVLSGVRVIARNWDGTCADCSTLNRLSPEECGAMYDESPPGLVVVVGGADPASKSTKYQCTATYCRRTILQNRVVIGEESDGIAPSDYLGACDVHATNSQGRPIFESLVRWKSKRRGLLGGGGGKGKRNSDATTTSSPSKWMMLRWPRSLEQDELEDRRPPPPEAAGPSIFPEPRIAWIPILSPVAHVRALWEQSSMYAATSRFDENVSTLPPLAARQAPKRKPRTADTLSDYAYLKTVSEPAFERTGRTPIDLVRDDAMPKPLLLPASERVLFEKVAAQTGRVRSPRLLYVGQFRESKGQLAFLQKLDEDSLGPFVLELRGTIANDVVGDYDEIKAEMARFTLGKVVINEERISHEMMMNEMASASGLVHYALYDRNPRVLYEALYFGLPLFVSIQSMPYIALQCQTFVQLTDVEHSKTIFNSQLKSWVDSLADNEHRKRKVAKGLKNKTTTSFQRAILAFVHAHLTPNRVYLSLCERFGLCGGDDEESMYVDANTPWLLKDKQYAHEKSAAPLGKHGENVDRKFIADKPHVGKKLLESGAMKLTNAYFRPRQCGVDDALWRFENWRKPWNSTKSVRSALDISNTPTCNIVETKRNCRDSCRKLNRQDKRRDRRRAWWSPSIKPKSAI